MSVSEGARNDLYNGLVDLLGVERAETLMTFLPTYEPSEVATRVDVQELRDELAAFRSEIRDEVGGLRAEMNSRFEELGKRIDRVLLTLVAGLFVIVAGVIGLVGVVISII